jgi:hypothetical protein
MGSLRRFLAIAALLACLPVAAEEDEIDVSPAIAVAEAWLHLLDTGRYGTAWEEMAPTFQEAMSRHRWETTLPGARDPLGPVLSRKMRQADVTKSQPSAPAGDLVIIYFNTHFQNRLLTTEVVTPMKVGDRWRVSNYIIR